MANSPTTQWPTQTTAPDADYPHGGAQNITTPGDNTGTPFVASLVNDIFGFQQAMLDAAGIVPSNSPDTVQASQYLESLQKMGGIEIYTTAGAHALVLPDWVKRIKVIAIGGGGGGAASVTNGTGGSGGAGGTGGVGIAVFDVTDVNCTINVGAGGAGGIAASSVYGAQGSAGSNSTFDMGLKQLLGFGGGGAAIVDPPVADEDGSDGGAGGAGGIAGLGANDFFVSVTSPNGGRGTEGSPKRNGLGVPSPYAPSVLGSSGKGGDGAKSNNTTTPEANDGANGVAGAVIVQWGFSLI